MMRRFSKYALMLTASIALLSACVREFVPSTEKETRPYLSVLPGIFNGDKTKVADTDSGIKKGDLVDSRDELRENFFGSLDIFVKRQDAAESAAWFRQYHLNAGDAGVVIDTEKYDSESLLNEAKQLLASNWAELIILTPRQHLPRRVSPPSRRFKPTLLTFTGITLPIRRRIRTPSTGPTACTRRRKTS